MKGRNCRGVLKKEKLDEKILDIIQEHVYKCYPDTPENIRNIWGQCTKTIDWYIRNKHRQAKK